MRKSLYCSIFFFIFLTGVTSMVFAADEPQTSVLEKEGNPQTYEDFKSLLSSDCDNPSKKWMNSSEGGSLSVPPEYPAFDIGKINSHILSAIAADKKGILASELDPNKIGSFDGIKSLEIARIEYRNAMNDLFACAVIDSRIQILKELQEKIKVKFPTPNNELTLRLNKIATELTQFRTSMTSYCTAPKESKIAIETQIKNTATRQYCHFNHYLNYLKSNLEKDNAHFMDIENGIGSGSGTHIPKTSDEWVNETRKRQNQIDTELLRAKTTLPRAIRAFQEMKRTYPLHIMFAVIYDDYIRLRENLNRYFNANTQLFEKMNNAQDVNAR